MASHLNLILICTGILIITIDDADAIFNKLWTWKPWSRKELQVTPTSGEPPHNVSHRPLDNAYRTQLIMSWRDMRDLQRALRMIKLKWKELCDEGIEVKSLDLIMNETEHIVKDKIEMIDSRLDEDNGSIEMTDPIYKCIFMKLVDQLKDMKNRVVAQPREDRKNPKLRALRDLIVETQKQFNKAYEEMRREIARIKRKKVQIDEEREMNVSSTMVATTPMTTVPLKYHG